MSSSTRIPSHKLSGGLYVSGLPETTTPRPSPSSTAPTPYTGGDIKSSGDLSKLFTVSKNIHGSSGEMSRMVNLGNSASGSVRSGLNSGPKLSNSKNVSGEMPRMVNLGNLASGSVRSGLKNVSGYSGEMPRMVTGANLSSGFVRSGPNSGSVMKNVSGEMPKGSVRSGSNSGSVLQPTGLITSGPITSGPLGVSTGRRAGEGAAGGKVTVYGPAVTNLGKGGGGKTGFGVSKGAMWAVAIAVLMGVVVGVFLTVAVKKVVVIAVVAGVVVVVVAFAVWNLGWKKRGVLGYWKGYPDAELRGALDGQYVKVTGVVTCGSIPLESSFQKVPRCVYASTELYEYRGWGGKSAIPKQRFFSWGCRQSEKYVADFYISDFQSGLRALVKAGYGAKVSVFVEETTVVDMSKNNRDSSPSFLSWLSDRSLPSNDRIMRLKEGYIKEGSTVSVIGIVRRHDNVLMIVPPTEPVSTKCQWLKCLLPSYNEGLIVLCDESQTEDVIAV